MDFSRNFRCPNIATNVFHKCRLSVFIFNIHTFSNSFNTFYVYPETDKKVSDEVCSFLHGYITNILDPSIKQFEIFCNSCPGQNKNVTVLQMCHHLVHTEKKVYRSENDILYKGPPLS